MPTPRFSRVVPRARRGSLPITYHVGPGAAVAHLVVKFDWSLKPIYDVIAIIKGSSDPGGWVVREQAEEPAQLKTAGRRKVNSNCRYRVLNCHRPHADQQVRRAATPCSPSFWSRQFNGNATRLLISV